MAMMGLRLSGKIGKIVKEITPLSADIIKKKNI